MGEKKGFFWLYLSMASLAWVALYALVVKWKGGENAATQAVPAEQIKSSEAMDPSGEKSAPAYDRQTKSS